MNHLLRDSILYSTYKNLANSQPTPIVHTVSEFSGWFEMVILVFSKNFSMVTLLLCKRIEKEMLQME